MNILLIAESKAIHARKQELSVEKIEKLTAEYQSLFNEFQRKYPHSKFCTIQNDSIQETADKIFQEIKIVA